MYICIYICQTMLGPFRVTYIYIYICMYVYVCVVLKLGGLWVSSWCPETTRGVHLGTVAQVLFSARTQLSARLRRLQLPLPHVVHLAFGSLGLWVFGSLGLWVFGSLGLWVAMGHNLCRAILGRMNTHVPPWMFTQGTGF